MFVYYSEKHLLSTTAMWLVRSYIVEHRGGLERDIDCSWWEESMVLLRHHGCEE